MRKNINMLGKEGTMGDYAFLYDLAFSEEEEAVFQRELDRINAVECDRWRDRNYYPLAYTIKC